MGLNINTNIAALKARQQLTKNAGLLQKSLERLSTGLRINWAADDAAGLAIADSLRATAKGLSQAIRNANEGISLIKVADGALIEYGNILATIKEKVTQAANGTQTAETRKALQRDINKLLQELNNIARTTEFNGQKILSGSFVNKKFQIGSASFVTTSLSIRSAETNAVGGTKTATINLNSIGPVQLTLTNASSGLSVTTEKIELLYNNNPDNGAGALANEINRYSGITGITAVAVVEVQSEPIQAGTITGLKINGVTIGDITVQAADADGALTNAINQKSLETGVTATVTEDGRLVLTSTDGRAIKVEADSGLGTVLGKAADELSTLGYVRVIQKGVADFQIEGVGGTGIGANFQVDSADTVTLDAKSTLEAGSTIAGRSYIEGGSIFGGDTYLLSTMRAEDNAIALKAGSVVGAHSVLARGTVVTGDVVVSGDTNPNNPDTVALQQDMLLKAGSVLKKGSVIGAGTVVYGSLAQALGVTDGTVIGNNGATLQSDVTLNTDIVLKYSTVTNSEIAAGSTIAAGSKLGADFDVGYVWNTAASSKTYDTATTAMTQRETLTADASLTFTADSSQSATVDFDGWDYIMAGTRVDYLATSGTPGSIVISLANGVNTYIHYRTQDGEGYLTGGQSITLDAANEYFEILDPVFLRDSLGATSNNLLTITLTGGTGTGTDQMKLSLKKGSYIDLDITLSGASVNSYTFYTATNGTAYAANFSEDTELLSGSKLINRNSKLAAGSVFGSEAYITGNDGGIGSVTTTEESVLQRSSVLQGLSTVAQGSVITTDDFQLRSDTTLQQDTLIGAGSTLKVGTKLAKGTVVQETLTLYTGADTNSTAVTVTAGTTLDQDLYVRGSDITLANDMILAEGSQIAADSVLSLKSLGEMGNVETWQLSDLNVLTYENAEISLTVVEAAISDIDGIRSELGSVQNQLESTVANISVTYTNTKAAEAAIRDVDFAEEVSNFTKMQVLMQAGTFALAQANTIPQMAIQLLQG